MNIGHREFTRITKHIAIIIDGKEYDGVDLYKLLTVLKEYEQIYITSSRVASMLEGLNIISSRGNKYLSATKGPAFDEFYSNLVNKFNFDEYEQYS